MSDSDTRGVNRRDFLSASALPFAAAAALAPVLGAAQVTSTGRDGDSSARSSGNIRVGIIGAGSNVQRNQIPNLKKIEGCEILGVANRSLASSQRVADQFGIPRAYSNWGELMADDDIDAILIGTWPYVHRTMTLAALERGKHVLCQGRMARTAAEARDMLEASRRHPDLVTQVVPMSQSYWQDNVLKRLLGEGYVGEVLSVQAMRPQTGRRELTGERGFADFGGELSWRHQQQYGGYNTLTLGQSYEAISRWLGAATRVMAMSKIHVPYRKGPDGDLVAVDAPDHVDVIYELANGAQVHLTVSATMGLSTGEQTWIFGTEGTIHADSDRTIWAGKRGDSELSKVPNPPEQQARYRVEEEFINAIRGIEEIKMNTFEIGLQYMEFIEAVYRSSRSGEAVYLPM